MQRRRGSPSGSQGSTDVSSEGEVDNWGLALPRPPSPLSRSEQSWFCCFGGLLVWMMVDHFNVLKIQKNPNLRRFSSPPSTVHEVDSMRLPVVPVVVVTEPPPADQEHSINPVSPKFLFQVGPCFHFPNFCFPLSFSSVFLYFCFPGVLISTAVAIGLPWAAPTISYY